MTPYIITWLHGALTCLAIALILRQSFLDRKNLRIIELEKINAKLRKRVDQVEQTMNAMEVATDEYTEQMKRELTAAQSALWCVVRECDEHRAEIDTSKQVTWKSDGAVLLVHTDKMKHKTTIRALIEGEKEP